MNPTNKTGVHHPSPISPDFLIQGLQVTRGDFIFPRAFQSKRQCKKQKKENLNNGGQFKALKPPDPKPEKKKKYKPRGRKRSLLNVKSDSSMGSEKMMRKSFKDTIAFALNPPTIARMEG